MHIHFLDPFQYGTSFIHRLDARIKFVLVLAFIFTVALTPMGVWPIYISLYVIILSAIILSEVGVGFVSKRSLLVLPFVLAVLPIIFTLEGKVLWSISLGTWTLSIYQPGLERFISIVIKSFISVQAAILLTTTTPFPDLLTAMRAVRIPRLLVAIFGLMWRYLFVLSDEALRLLRARTSRSGHSEQPDLKPGGNAIWRAKIAGGMAGSLFLRAFERSDRIYMAMLSRGYDGEVRSTPMPPISPFNWSILFVSLIFLITLLGLSFVL
jgi:cobalt/nickel transport system permease protein